MTRSTVSSPTRLTARSPDDLLAAVPVVLGFWPTDSVVMLTFGGHDPFHARVDLPEHLTDLPELAAVLAAPAVRHGVERVVLLVYTDDARLAAAAWRALRAAFRSAGIGVAEALRVGERRWFPMIGGDPTARAKGVAYSPARLAAHPFLAQSVVDGRVTHGSRAELAATLAPSSVRVAAVTALVTGRPPPDDPVAELAEGLWVEGEVSRHLEEGTRPTDAEAARLLEAIGSLRVRDAAWSVLTRSRVRAAVELFTDLVQRAPDHLVPGPAALLAWGAWQAGDGALAWCAVDRCLAADPGYGLGTLVAEALERAVPPSACAADFDWKEGLDTAGDH